MSFESFHFNPRIESGIGSVGYTVPTAIQIQCIPPVLNGKDVIGLAQTGTGKTAAFALPILQRLMAGPRKRLPCPDHRTHAGTGRTDPRRHQPTGWLYTTEECCHLWRREQGLADHEAPEWRRNRRGMPGTTAGPHAAKGGQSGGRGGPGPGRGRPHV